MASSASDQSDKAPSSDALMKPLRVCLVAASAGQGGLEKHVVMLANQLAIHGHSVSVIVDVRLKHDFSPAVCVFAYRLAGSRLNLLSWWSIFRVLAKLKPDVVHAHAGKAVSMCWLACRLLGLSLVGTLHNRKRTVSNFEPCDRVIAVSRIISKGIPADRLHIVYNGIEPPALKATLPNLAQHCNFDETRPIFLAVGRLVKAKGFDLLIPAAVDAGIQLVIVGDGTERNNLEASVPSLASIRFLGHRDDVFELMAASDGVVISSRHEGGPIVLAEALLLSKPIISTRVGMVPEFIADEWLCDTTQESLSAALKRAALNTKAWTESQSHAFENARRQLTLIGMTHETVAVYRTVSGLSKRKK